MVDNMESSQLQSSAIKVEDFKLNDRFEISSSLSMFRDVCYMLPENIALNEVVSE